MLPWTHLSTLFLLSSENSCLKIKDTGNDSGRLGLMQNKIQDGNMVSEGC